MGHCGQPKSMKTRSRQLLFRINGLQSVFRGAVLPRATSVAALLLTFAAFGQTPERYDCRYAAKAITVDGRLNESAWRQAPWSGHFVDIEGSKRPAPRFRTRMKMSWVMASGASFVFLHTNAAHHASANSFALRYSGDPDRR